MWHNILSAGSRWQQLAIMSSYLNVSLLSLFLSIYCLSLSVILSLCISLQRVHSLYVLFRRLPLPLSFFITFLVLCVNPPQQMCLSAAEQRGNLWVDSSKIEREKKLSKNWDQKTISQRVTVRRPQIPLQFISLKNLQIWRSRRRSDRVGRRSVDNNL